MIKIGNLRKLCSGCQELRWCHEGQGYKVGEVRCKKPYSVCRNEDAEACV
jgi:hypothetical protein